jgi:hypothetical protein
MLSTALGRLTNELREPLALAFSDHLTTNCMLTAYAFGWRRLTPLFTVRAFRHVTRPVELNPWLVGTGRGTFPNAARQVQRAAEFAMVPKEPVLSGGFRAVPLTTPVGSAEITNGDARRLSHIEDRSVDLVITDPPYFDNIAYSELSDFFRPWLRQLKVVPHRRATSPREDSLIARGRGDGSATDYEAGLGQSFSEIRRVLKTEGRAVFTYRHKTALAWMSIARALRTARLKPVQLIPLLGDGTVGLHVHNGTITWDAVFVLTKDTKKRRALRVGCDQLLAAKDSCARWEQRLKGDKRFRREDALNLRRAHIVAAALGMFGGQRLRETHELDGLLVNAGGIMG